MQVYNSPQRYHSAPGCLRREGLSNGAGRALLCRVTFCQRLHETEMETHVAVRLPVVLLDCYFGSAINLNEATAVSVRLSGSHVPTVCAQQLLTSGDLWLDKGFSVLGEVELTSAHIGGQLDCTGGQFSNPNDIALNADGLTVDAGMFCRKGFLATGEVHRLGAHISSH